MSIKDGTLRTLWLSAGGTFHGPNVEHGSMKESDLLVLLRSLHVKTTALQAILDKTTGSAELHPLWLLASNALRDDDEPYEANVVPLKAAKYNGATMSGFMRGNHTFKLFETAEKAYQAVFSGLDVSDADLYELAFVGHGGDSQGMSRWAHETTENFLARSETYFHNHSTVSDIQ